MSKRVCIVFEETSGKGFQVYIEGLSPEANEMTPEEQMKKLSPADFWGMRMFQICAGIMCESGVVNEIKKGHMGSA
jgi:hypothetical protein